MMTGAFSAAFTAFVAVQFSGRIGGAEWVLWVAPTTIMVAYGRYEMRRCVDNGREAAVTPASA